MDIDRSTALTLALLLGGLALVVAPLAAQPHAPPDKLGVSVEGNWDDYQSHPNLVYANLSERGQALFDDGLAATPNRVNYTDSEVPDRLDPGEDAIEVYDVRYDGDYYLLEIRHLTDGVDFVTQVVPRLLAGVVGLVALFAGGYRRFR